jgi:high-affinity iron transporter
MILAPFLIMLREGLEAALIVSIIASYLRQSGGRQWLPAIWLGVFLALALSLFVGAILQFVSAEFPQKAQELFEAAIGFVAVIVLTSMVFWMHKEDRTLGAELLMSPGKASG